jgi:hypothetical protein
VAAFLRACAVSEQAGGLVLEMPVFEARLKTFIFSLKKIGGEK